MVHISRDAIIPEDKLTRYLLAPRPRNDKSKYLARAGFTLLNWQALLEELQRLTREVEVVEDITHEYGTFYLVEGRIKGPNGLEPDLITVWLKSAEDNRFRFITLKPGRRDVA